MWNETELATIKTFLDQVGDRAMLEEMLTTLDDLGLTGGNPVVPMLSDMVEALRTG